MDPLNIDNHPALLWLIAWRATLGLIAAYLLLEKSLSAAFFSLLLLAVLLMLGEAAYRSKVHLDAKRLREEQDRILREQRAEEARQRFEALRQREGRRGLMSLDAEDELQPSSSELVGIAPPKAPNQPVY